MTYASSYAGGSLPLQHESQSGAALPAPRPRRMHWSTLLLIGGLSVCFVALLATLAGVPARMGYDVDGAPQLGTTDSNNPLVLMRSLDGNMKWVSEASGTGKGQYVGWIRAINVKEASIPAMITALVAMDSAVRAIDDGLGSVEATTTQMNADMAAMSKASSAAGASMEALGSDVGLLSKSMLSLATSTQQLTQTMAAIEEQATGISTTGTSGALAVAKELNAALPAEVPAPVLEGASAAAVAP